MAVVVAVVVVLETKFTQAITIRTRETRALTVPMCCMYYRCVYGYAHKKHVNFFFFFFFLHALDLNHANSTRALLKLYTFTAALCVYLKPHAQTPEIGLSRHLIKEGGRGGRGVGSTSIHVHK